jgi:hypothetical protein
VTLTFQDHGEAERFRRHICAMAGVRDWHQLMSDGGRRDRTIMELIRSALPQEG